jgi:hypothetical protein
MPITPCGTYAPTVGDLFAIVDPRGGVSMKPDSFDTMFISTDHFQSVQHWMLEIHNEWLHSPPCVARSHILRQCRKLCHRWGVLALRILRFAQELVPPGSQLNDLLLDPGTLLRQSVPFSLEDRNLSLGCGLRLQQSFLLAGSPLRRGHPQYFCSDHDGFMSLRPGGFSSFRAVACDQRWR